MGAITGTPGIVINNLMRSCTNAFRSGGNWYAEGSDYNATDLASLNYTVVGSGNTHDHVSHTFTFTDEANDNFHLASNDVGANDLGKDLSATFTDDIDGVTRTGTWDIGADEYVASGVDDTSYYIL